MSSQSHSFKTNDSSSLESEIIEKPFWQLGSFIKFVQSGSDKKKKKKGTLPCAHGLTGSTPAGAQSE